MKEYRLEPCDRDRWVKTAPSFRDYNYRQLWAFGQACARRVGAVSEHVAVVRDGEVLGLADVRVKRIPLIGGGIAYINGGPLVRRNDPSDGRRLLQCLAALEAEYVRRRKLVLRIACPLGPPDWLTRQEEALAGCGFAPNPRLRAYRTLVVDLDRPIEAIRRGLDQKWRNCLNRSEKNGLTIRSGDSQDLFAEFCGLYRQLLDRKGFEVDLDADFYAAVQEHLTDGQRFLVSIADFRGQAVAGHVASILGDTCVYLLGASSAEGMQSKASYMLQWHVIQTARSRGCRAYDLGGIDPEGNPGVYHFKNGLGGRELVAGRALEKAGSPVSGAAARLGDTLRACRFSATRDRGTAVSCPLGFLAIVLANRMRPRPANRHSEREGPKRILAISSGGGHWVQLLRLRPAFEGHMVTYVTVDAAYRLDVQGERFRTVNDATRWDKAALALLALRVFLLLVRLRPHVIVSTGAAPGYFAIRLGRWTGARTIWLDSIANVEELSLSGQRVGRYVDLWLTQWSHLSRPEGPKYAGTVL